MIETLPQNSNLHPAPAALDDYVLGLLTLQQHAQVEEHIPACRVCRERIRDENDYIDTLKIVLLTEEAEDMALPGF